MECIKHHHHFKQGEIEPGDRVALCERYVIDVLLNSTLPDSRRENSIAWEFKHHAGVTQLGRLLARLRGLPIDICSVAALLHDIYAIVYGTYRDHAHLGAPIAAEIAREKGFSDEEAEAIERIVYHHSDKEVISVDKLQEFGKDADILDIFLYPGPFAEYLLIKSLPVFKHYLLRAIAVWEELGLPDDPRFHLLDGYGDHWFTELARLTPEFAEQLTACLFDLSDLPVNLGVTPPPFCTTREERSGAVVLYGNRHSWNTFHETILTQRLVETNQPVLLSALEAIEHGSTSAVCRPQISLPAQSALPWDSFMLTMQSQGAILSWPLAGVYEILDSSRGGRLKEIGFD
jgi:hypothetical protein